jgi:hypothetical protein
MAAVLVVGLGATRANAQKKPAAAPTAKKAAAKNVADEDAAKKDVADEDAADPPDEAREAQTAGEGDIWPYGRPGVILGASGALMLRFSGNDDVLLRWAELGGVGSATVPQLGAAVDVSIAVRVFPWLSVGAIYHTLQQASVSPDDGATGPELDFTTDAIVNVARFSPFAFRYDSGYAEPYLDAGVGLGFMRDANEALAPAVTVGLGFDFISNAIIGVGVYTRFWWLRFASIDDAGGAVIQLQNQQDVAVDVTGMELLGLRLTFGY